MTTRAAYLKCVQASSREGNSLDPMKEKKNKCRSMALWVAEVHKPPYRHKVAILLGWDRALANVLQVTTHFVNQATLCLTEIRLL